MNNDDLNTPTEDNEKFSSVIKKLIDSILDGKNYLLISWDRKYQKTLLLELSKRINSPIIFVSPLKNLLLEDAAYLSSVSDGTVFIGNPREISRNPSDSDGTKPGKFKIILVPAYLLEESAIINFIKSQDQIYLIIDEAEIISESGIYSKKITNTLQELIKITKIRGLISFSTQLDTDLWENIKFKLKSFNILVEVLGLTLNNISLNVLFSARKEIALKNLLNSGDIKFPFHMYGTEDDIDYNNEIFSTEHSKQSPNLIDYNVKNFHLEGKSLESSPPLVIGHYHITLNKYLKYPDIIIIYSLPDSLEEILYMLFNNPRENKTSKIYILFDLREKIKRELQIHEDTVTQAKIMKILSLMRFSNINSKEFGEKELIRINKNFKTVLGKNNISQRLFRETIGILINSNYLVHETSPGEKIYIRILLKEDKFEEYINFIRSYSLKNLLLLIREIGGDQIFSSSVGIRLVELLFGSSLTNYKILDFFEHLKSAGILEFEQDSNPEVFIFKKKEVNSRFIDINNHQIRLLGGSPTDKFNSLINFIFSEGCRVNLFNEYLNQKNTLTLCGVCDNCTGIKILQSHEDLRLRELILKTLMEGKDKLRHQRLFQILKGETGSEINKKYSSYGACPSLTPEKFNSSLSTLISEELIKNIVNELVLTPVGKEYDNGAIQIDKKGDGGDNYESDLLLFNQLRQVRKEASIKFSQSAEIICPDQILKKIVTIKPHNITELLKVKGFTQRMFNKMGLELMSILSKIPHEGKNQSVSDTVLQKQFQKTLEMVNKGYLLSDIARILRIPESLAAFQVESIISYYPSIDINSLIPRKELKMIEDELIKEELELKSLKKKLPNSMSYAKIRIVLAKWKVSHSI